MHSVTHFLIALSLLLPLHFPLPLCIAFALLFGVLIDLDILVGRAIGKPQHHSRTWVQEPLGVLLLGIPIGLLTSLFVEQGVLLVIIPYASHVLLDYVSIHEVSPLAPFSKKNLDVGFITPIGKKNPGKLSEWYVLVASFVVCIVLVLF